MASLPRTLATLGLCAAAAVSQTAGPPPADPTAPPPLAEVVRVFAGGRPLDLDTLWDRLAAADVVFLGETHLDETTHRFELAIYRALLGRRHDQVVLAMEMFERDEQPALDDYVAGRIDEPAFRAATGTWGNYDTGYRALLEHARRQRRPVVGANLPQSLRRVLAFGGAAAFGRLSEAQRAMLPPEILPNRRQYWERVARVTRGHMGGAGSTDPQQNLYSTQSLWDNCMGWSCAQALDRWPDHLVLHVNGGFHTAYRDGTAHQLLQRRPDAAVLTVDIAPADDLARLQPADDRDRADFVVYAHARNRGVDEGMHAVSVARELEFRLHVPAAAAPGAPVPLLVWLADDGLRSAEGLAYWQRALGERAAIAAVEPPFLEREDDLHLGGRWLRDSRFRQDLGPLRAGLARLRRYLLRHYPLDGTRVVLAGQGVGGAVVVSTMVHARDLDVTALAVAPRPTAELGEQGLPDPATRRGTLAVLAAEDQLAWWRGEVAQLAEVGVHGEVRAVAGDPAAQIAAAERAIRAALGLPDRAPAGDAVPTWLVLEQDSALARHWALLAARGLPAGAVQAIVAQAEFVAPDRGPGRVVPLAFAPLATALPAGVEQAAAFGPKNFANGRALPLYPGPFGGTTVLVVPADAPADTRRQWQQLADDDAIKQVSRFCRLVIAYEAGGPSLADVLDEIRGAGRRNALVVPARYCAGVATMRALAAQAQAFEDSMALAWLPGLGGGLRL